MCRGGSVQRITYHFGIVCRVDTLTIEEESARAGSLALTLAKGVHELFEGGGALDFEKDFVVVVRDLDVQMFHGRGLLVFWLVAATWSVGTCILGHFEGE